MSLQVERLEHNMAKLTIEVPAEEVEKALQAAYLKERGKISLPGFRKGRVPRQMIEKMYGPEVFYDEAANRMISEAYAKAYDECELELVSQPKIEITQLEKGKEFIFTAEVAVKPEVKLGEYKGLKVDKVSTRVTQKEVDEEIDKERERNARTIDVTDRAVQDKDQITLDFEGFVDGVAFEGGKASDYPLTIGSGAFIPGFEDQLVGAETDADVDVKVTFPEEYHAENLAGKDAVFKVKVKEIKKRELPELDDDFASEVSEFDTMDEFRADVRKKLEEAAENKAKVETENAVIDKVIENAEFDLPDAMVETQIDNSVRDFAQRLSYQGMNLDMYMQYTGMTMDALRAQFAEQAKKQLSGSLVLEAIQKAEGIEAGPEEVELELVDMSKKYNMELDKLKELLGDAEKESIKKDLEIQKTITMIVNNAQVK